MHEYSAVYSPVYSSVYSLCIRQQLPWLFWGGISSETGPQLAANDFEKRPDRRFKFNWQSLIKGSSSSLSLSVSPLFPPSLSPCLYEWLNINFVIFIHTQWPRLLGNDVIWCVELTLQLALSQESLKRERMRGSGSGREREHEWERKNSRERESSCWVAFCSAVLRCCLCSFCGARLLFHLPFSLCDVCALFFFFFWFVVVV